MMILEKRKKSKTGIIQKLVVYSQDGGAIIGSGWVITANGRMYAPTLISLDGKELPQGWYNLRVVDDGSLVVLNRSVH